MADLLRLQLLDPVSDLELFQQAYSWRVRPKPHVQPDRMSFADFSAGAPTDIAIGLFNGDFQALYFLHEVQPAIYQAHFTARPKTSRELLLWGAALIIREFFTNGAKEIHAWVTPRNKPLQTFLTHLGFECVAEQHFPCTNETHESNIATDATSVGKLFVKYALFGIPPSV